MDAARADPPTAPAPPTAPSPPTAPAPPTAPTLPDLPTAPSPPTAPTLPIAPALPTATTTIAMTGQKRLRPKSSTSHFDIPAAKMLITASDLVDDVPKKMSGRMRQERMSELEKLIAANKAQQEAKLVELEQAQQLCIGRTRINNIITKYITNIII